MRITRRQLRRIIKEEMKRTRPSRRRRRVLREASIEVDWAGDLRDLQSLPPGLSGEVISQSGPGGGWPVVVITGERHALKDWYINDYTGDPQAGGEFEEFYP